METVQKMTSMPKISVVLTVYNGADVVMSAINSVMKQTFADFECIVINDGSTDQTGLLLDGIEDPKIKIIHQENKGIWASRNIGVMLAKGKWIANIDADDTWHPEKLQKQWHYLQGHPNCVLLGTFTRVTDHDGAFLYDEKKLTDHQALSEALMRGNQFTNSSVVFKKEAFVQVGGYPGKLRSGFEDYLLFVRLANVGQVANLPEFLVNYRVSHTSVSLRHELRAFTELKMACIQKGAITESDAAKLSELAASQRESMRKRLAGYYFFCGRAFLFYNFKRHKAITSLAKSIFHNPLWFKSWVYLGMAALLPFSAINAFYERRFGKIEFVR
jgi:glycosyltransferase involved in cell wall biosynthesis